MPADLAAKRGHTTVVAMILGANRAALKPQRRGKDGISYAEVTLPTYS